MARAKSQSRLLADAADEVAAKMPKVMGRNRSQVVGHAVQALNNVEPTAKVQPVGQDIGRSVTDQLETVYGIQQHGAALTDKKLDNILTLLEDWWRWQRRVEDVHQKQRAMDKRLEALQQSGDKPAANDDGEQPSGSLLDRWGGDKKRKDRERSRDRRKNRERNRDRQRYGSGGRDGRSRGSRPVRRPPTRGGRAGRWAALGAALWGGYELMSGDDVTNAAVQIGADTAENLADRTPEVTRTPPTPAPTPTPDRPAPSLLSRIEDNAVPFAKKAGKTALRHAGTVAVAGFAAKDAWDVHNNKDMTSSEKNREYSKLAGGVAGSVAGGTAGMAIGAAVGQALIPIPVVGAVIGGIAGELIGSLAGEYGGQYLGGKGYDMVSAAQDWMRTTFDPKNGLTVHVESPDIQKIADAATQASIADKSGLSTAQVKAMSGYVTGVYGTPTTTPLNYGYGSQKVTYSDSKVDYRKEYGYVPYQGVMKDVKPNAKVESRLSQYNDLFDQYGKQQGLDPLLLRSLVRQESQGDPNAVSHAGAVGLAQFMPATAQDMGITDRTDPRQSVAGSAKYMRMLMDKYNGDTKLALAAYNAGMGNIDKAIKTAGTRDADTVLNTLPQVTGKRAAETQGYVRNITAYHSKYREQAGADSGVPEVARATQPVEKTGDAERSSAATKIAAVDQQAQPPVVPKLLAKPEQKERVRQAPSQVSAPPTLDTMPLLITDMGMSDLLLSKV